MRLTRSLRLVALLAAGLLSPNAAWTQTPDQSPAPPAGPAGGSGPASLESHGSPDAATSGKAVALLNNAIAAIERAKALNSTSEMQIMASTQGTAFVFKERLHLVTLRPQRFHSDITVLSGDGTPGTRYTVICDGDNVWTYQPGARRYAVTPCLDFFDNNLSASLGVFGGMLAEGDLPGGLNLKKLTRSGVRVQGGTRSVDGVEYSVVVLSAPKQGMKLRFLLDPQTATIQRLDMAGRQRQVTFAITEQMLRQSSSPTLPAALFRFAPPPGVRRVEKISIGPF